jgi:hypothetical protein
MVWNGFALRRLTTQSIVAPSEASSAAILTTTRIYSDKCQVEAGMKQSIPTFS